MQRILITGIDDLVGNQLAATWAAHYTVLGVSGHSLFDSRGVSDSAVVEASSADDWSRVIDDFQPDHVVHCGPLARSSWDLTLATQDEHRNALDDALDAEPTFVAALCDAMSRSPAKLVFIGSDAVFSGPHMFHAEDDTRCGSGPLAEVARAVEDLVRGRRAISPKSLLVRTHLFGHGEGRGAPGFVSSAYRALSEDHTVVADAVRHATPIVVQDMADLLVCALQRELCGVLHLAGAERASPVRMVTELASLMGQRARVETPDAWETPGPVAETTLSTHLARRRLGRALPLLRDGLARFLQTASDDQGAMPELVRAA